MGRGPDLYARPEVPGMEGVGPWDGVTGPTGPRVFLGAVPFPSPANTSFTPTTTPSSKSTLGGGYDVYITDIRRRADGRVTFQVGYEYQ